MSVRPVSYWLEELRVMGIIQCHGYHSVSWVSLSVMSDTPQCHEYHSVSGLFVKKTGSLGVMGKFLGGL